MRALAIVILLAACSKKEEKAAPPTPAPTEAPTTAPAATGPRTIAIEAGMKGYVPDTISGKAGEKLELQFTRTVEGACLEELRTPDNQVVKLPMNTPVKVAVTVPASGELTFACGMDMFQGKIVAGG